MENMGIYGGIIATAPEEAERLLGMIEQLINGEIDTISKEPVHYYGVLTDEQEVETICDTLEQAIEAAKNSMDDHYMLTVCKIIPIKEVSTEIVITDL